METQRLRNLTTGRLHTEVGHIYKDLEFITGMDGLMTHMLPNVMRAVEPWLRGKVEDNEYWDGAFDPNHFGEHPIEPMNQQERADMLARYGALPHPLAGKDVIVAAVE